MTPETARALIADTAFPRGLAWGVSVATDDPGALYPQEAAAMARAVPQRRAEFTGGRIAARQALGGLGLAPVALPVGPGRAPVWPEGLCGSITHSEGLCLAVAGRSRTWQALGVDIEPDSPLDPLLIPEICLHGDLDTVPSVAQPLQARRVFSAKEAVFKALYPRTGVMFGFHGLRVDLGHGIARLAAHPETAPIPACWHGRDLPVIQRRASGMILSLSALPV